MKKVFLGIAILGVVLFFGYQYFSKSSKKIYKSPDGKYTLEISTGKSGNTPGDGGGSTALAQVVLKDADGTVIGESSNNPDCAIFLDSVEVIWDIENDLVFYGKAKSINLKTGKVEC